MAIIEESAFGETRSGGSKVILPRVVTTIVNRVTDTEYASEVAAQADVADPDTATGSTDIQRNVILQVLRGVVSK